MNEQDLLKKDTQNTQEGQYYQAQPTYQPQQTYVAPEAPANNYYQDNTYNSQTYQYVEDNNNQNTSNGGAIAGLVLGILGIVLSCCCGLGFILGLIGIACAVSANKKCKSGAGTAGLVCSVIATILGALGLVYWIYCFVVAGSSVSNFEDMMEMLEMYEYYY